MNILYIKRTSYANDYQKVLEVIMQYSEWSALDIVHKVVSHHVKKGDFCIDATAGNGYDTLFLANLVGESGHVLAMDIQESAVNSTKQKILDNGYNNCEVICKSHSDMDDKALFEKADAILFNFGWLPGGDHNIFTQEKTTIPALEKSLSILKPGGLLSLCVYYGKNNGYSEKDAIINFVSNLDCRYYAVMKCDFLNRKNDPPFPIFIIKESNNT